MCSGNVLATEEEKNYSQEKYHVTLTILNQPGVVKAVLDTVLSNNLLSQYGAGETASNRIKGFNHTWTITKSSDPCVEARQDDYIKGICSLFYLYLKLQK